MLHLPSLRIETYAQKKCAGKISLHISDIDSKPA
jgi:hypothetical protein